MELRWCVTKKGGVLTTHSTIDCPQTNPWRPTWSWSTILHTYPQASEHSVCLLTPVFAHYESETHNIQQHDKSHRIPTPTFLHSHTKDISRKTLSYCITVYLHPESTSSLLIQVHKAPNFPVIVQSLYLSKFLQQRLD
jgi:hypothetical protein